VPADKRFRRSDGRHGRRRNWRLWMKRAAWFGGGGVVALLLAAWLGSALLNAAVLEVRHVEISGNVRLPTEDVRARLDGLSGQSILRVNLETFHARLIESPWVASAELWRVLPSTIHVRIVEREPMAVGRLHSRLYLVAADGVVLDSFGPKYANYDLPIVDGLMAEGTEWPTADAEGSSLVQRLLTDLAARPDLLHHLSQVDVSDRRNAVVLMEGERAQLRLGDTDFLKRLERWEQIVPGFTDKPPAEYYELRFGDRVWVK
jgi:cell division protein FtsQ